MSELSSTDFFTDEKGKPSCSDVDPELFFPEDKQDANGKWIAVYKNEQEAKKVCNGCQYRIECLLTAVQSREIGIWGATTERERTTLLRNSKRRGLSISQIATSKKR